MPFNGSGVFQRLRNWVADATASVPIDAEYHDSEDDGFATGLSTCITKDGQTLITQNIPFNNKRITGLADPINPQDAATKLWSTTYTDTKAANYVLKAGDAMTGPLALAYLNPSVALDNIGGAGSAQVIGRKNGKARWGLTLGNSTAEAGSDVGSDYALTAYKDDGTTVVATALAFSRATGLGTVVGDPTVDFGISTKKYTDTGVTAATTAANNAQTTANSAVTAAAAAQTAANNAQTTADSKMSASGGSMTGTLSLRNTQHITYGGPIGGLQINSATGSAGISFLCEGSFGANFGLATDGNLYLGGWSFGGTWYRIWTTRDFSSYPVSNMRQTGANYHNHFYGEGLTVPYPSAIVTALGSGGSTLVAAHYRYLQMYTVDWYTVGTI